MANAFAVGATSGSNAGTEGVLAPIFGSNQTPYAYAVFAASGDNLTTGDLQAGDAGEMGNLAEFAVEFWFKTDTLPGAKNYIALGPTSSSGGVRQWAIAISVGNAILCEVRDNGGTTHTATGASTLIASSWYHIVCTAQGGSLRVYLNGVQDGADATWGSNVVAGLGAVAGSEQMLLEQTFAANTAFDEVATYRTGLTSTRVSAHYTAGVSRGWKFQNSGERMLAVLDACSHRSPRNIQAGARNVVPRYMSGQAPLEEMRLALEADDVDAQLFCSRSGAVTFLADGHRSSSPYNTVQAIFGNAGGSELPYLDLQVSYDVGQVINEWNVTRTPYLNTAPVTQTSSDATSQARYFKRSQSLSDVPTTNDTNAANIATGLLAKFKDPLYMVTSIKPNMADPATASAVYGLDLCDRVEVRWTPPGGGSRIDQTVFIQKIEHSQSPGMPSDTTLVVTPF